MTQVEADGERLAAISNAIVRIFRESYGRGPTKSHAFDAYVLCVLEDISPPSRGRFVENGEEKLVRDVRLRLPRRRRSSSRTPEELTGRSVIAYHSQVTFHPAVGFEMFVLGD